MNGNLKLVSWKAHLQPFFSQPHLPIQSEESGEGPQSQGRRPSLPARVKSLCCHLGTPHMQEGKNINGASKADLLLFVKLYQTLEKCKCIFENILCYISPTKEKFDESTVLNRKDSINI